MEQNRKDLRTSKAKHEDLMSLLLAPEINEEHNDYGCWYVEYACFEDYVWEKLENESLREELQS